MLTFTQVRKQFGSTVAVDGLSLAVHSGEVLGLLGPNGAGKTTSISMAVGLMKPDDGTITLGDAGLDPTSPEARRLIGVAPQSIALYDGLTADENLVFFGRLYGLHAGPLRSRVDEVLELTGLSDRRHDMVEGFSGGMKRRLNLAAAFIHEPRLVLMDEPTAGVDPQSRNAIFQIVRALRDRGCTIVYSTHYMEEAERLCDRVAIIDHGRLLALDTVSNLLAQHGGKSTVCLTRSGGQRGDEDRIETADPIGVLTEAARSGGIANARIEGPDLESVFLGLTGRTLRD